MFQPAFHEKVKSGEKRQTIRVTRKRPIKPGDHLSLRRWLGKPRRSKQEVLREETCAETFSVEINASGNLILVGIEVWPNKFAKADGFDDYNAMLAWFKKNHTLPFKGICIKW